MIKRALNKSYFKQTLTFVVCLSILALTLPCNCMADVSTEPVKSDHPCHSSDTKGDQNRQNHDNCCCSDGLTLFTPNLLVEVSAVQDLIGQDLLPDFSHSFLHRFEGETHSELIRGSPPDRDPVLISTSTFLAIIQRWLI